MKAPGLAAVLTEPAAYVPTLDFFAIRFDFAEKVERVHFAEYVYFQVYTQWRGEGEESCVTPDLGDHYKYVVGRE